MYTVETGGGVWTMYGRDMKDHNWRRGGYGTLTLPWCLKYSSNIGVSRIIDTFYHKNPEKVCTRNLQIRFSRRFANPYYRLFTSQNSYTKEK